MSTRLQHRGIVERIEGDKVVVIVEQQSACAACHAKGLCSEKGAKREIIVKSAYASQFSVGERVRVALLSNTMGFSSIIYGYILPLVVLLAALGIAKGIGLNDGIAAVAAISAVAVYYVGLYALRHKIEKKIEFTIIKE